jgi:hypothetical protein
MYRTINISYEDIGDANDVMIISRPVLLGANRITTRK